MSKMSSVTKTNVVREVVAKSLCCGCGVCAGVCPQGALEMRFNSRGELVPVLSGVCAECGLCLKVCPALELGEPLPHADLFGPETAARKDPHVGTFIEAYVGYSARHRERGASGGMVTWTLEELFRRGKIDAAVCVARSEKYERLFEAVVISSPSELLRCASTKYYPIEFSSVLRQIRDKDGRYGIVALPCAVTAIRKAQRALPVLRKRIRYVFGLVCGHGVSKRFTDFLLAMVGLNEGTARRVNYRYMGCSRTAINYAFRAQRKTGIWSRPIFSDRLLGRLWAGRFFVPKVCDFCDDLFAPLADATFMDAWLPEYIADPRGTSIVVVRHPEVAELLEASRKDQTSQLQPIVIERVRRSQSAALTYKTVHLPLRVARAERDGLRIPRSFPRAPLSGGLRERLVRIKQMPRERLSVLTFDPSGQARSFWVAILTAYLRGHCLWRAARDLGFRVGERIMRAKSCRMATKE